MVENITAGNDSAGGECGVRYSNRAAGGPSSVEGRQCEEIHGGWGYPSFMAWPETLWFARRWGMELIHFDQKTLGQIRIKPTTLLTNISALRELQDQRTVPISEEQYNQLQEEMENIETIPAMLVTVVRPPSRKKARIVACGNHSAPNPEDEMGTTVGGLECIVVRVLVSMASEKQWRM